MYDELQLDTLGDKKTALFLIMSDTDSTFNFLISMVYTQLFNLLCDKADDVYGGKLPIHVRCLIDECANIGQIFKRLYEDSVTGRISDERFTELSADYEAEQKELKERAAAIRAELSKAQEATVNAEKFMNVVRKYTSFEELTPTLLREFVEKIVVHECSYDENGTRRQDIDIYYSFVGKVDLPE